MKIIFFGSSGYCLPILNILKENSKLCAIVTKQNSKVEDFSRKNNIEVFTPKDNSQLANLINPISQFNTDLAIVADFGLIIPQNIFNLPKYKTLNIHFSRLPQFRGPSPVQYSILLGEKSTWISIIIMDETLDTGDIIWQKEVKLAGDETSGNLYQKLFTIVSLELPNIIHKFIDGKLTPKKQDHREATYTKHLTRQDGYIPPQTLSAALDKGIESVSIERKIRAFSPWPSVWTEITLQGRPLQKPAKQSKKKRLKILKAHLQPLASQGHALRSWEIKLDQVQLEGKKPASWKQFLEGHPDFSF